MRYFYVTDGNKLIPLNSFEFREGHTPTIRTPTFGSDIYGNGRKQPDTFSMDATGLGQQVGAFKVVDDNCFVYECIGANTTGSSGRMTVAGFVTVRWQIEVQDRAEAFKMMQVGTGT